MNIESIISYIATLGIGGLIGVLIKSTLDARLQNKRLLFEARTKAYAGISGRVLNLFQEPDIHALPDHVKIVRIGAILSEPMLLGSHELVDVLGDYRVKVQQFHVALTDGDEDKQIELHRELIKLAGRVIDQMRWDLHGGRKSVWD